MEQDRSHLVASGFLTLLASQIGTRIFTFTINLLIARHLTPEAYGLSSVQFHLLTTTALFISREGFRRGCLRFGGGGGGGGRTRSADGREVAGGSLQADGPKDKGTAKGEVRTHGDGGAGDGAGPSGAGDGVDSRGVLRVAALVVPLGLVVTAGVCGLALWRHGGGCGVVAAGKGGREPEVPYYREAVLLHGLAALLELLAEPFYILASVNLMFGPRVAVEFASNLTKSLVTLGLLSNRRLAAALPPALLFSVAQLALAVVVLVGYTAVGLQLVNRNRGRRGLPGGGGGAGGGWLAPWTPLECQVLGTSAIFTLQAVEKLALAEGSKLVLANMQSAVNQGVYGLVSNLGSLVVRTLFQPLEEAAFAAFSTWGADAKAAATAVAAAPENAGTKVDGIKATAAAATATGRPVAEGKDAPGQVDGPGGSNAGARLAPLARALSPMVKAVTVLGLLAAAFGPSYAYVLLRLVYGMRWSETEAPVVLAAYSVYVLLLALNGIGEAFVHAVLDARGLQQSNALLLVFSGAHVAACIGLVRPYGALGLVAADGANMVLRIAYSAWCIRGFFRPLQGFSLRRELLPAPATLAAFVIAAAAAAASNWVCLVAPGTDGSTPQRVFLRRAAAHVGVGVALLAALLGLMARTERGTLRQVMEMRRRRRRGAQEGGQGQEGAKAGGGARKMEGGKKDD